MNPPFQADQIRQEHDQKRNELDNQSQYDPENRAPPQ